MNKIIIIIGPTSSGKSELAVKLAKRFNGEIISCDSRQIYRGMNLGTGKVPGKWQALPFARHPERSEGSWHPERSEGSIHSRLVDITLGRAQNQQIFFYKSIPHHCIDYVSPKKQYSAALFQNDAKKAIANILSRDKLPILCGGTAHWIDAVVYNQPLPDVKPNAKLRRRLEKFSTECLFARISRLDPERTKSIDSRNRRRLIRALEIVIISGHPVPSVGDGRDRPLPYDALWIGITLPQLVLFSKIKKRLKQRLDAGMIKEVRHLHEQLLLAPSSAKRGSQNPLPFAEGEVGRGLSWRRLESFGLEYRYVSLYLQKKISFDEMLTRLSFAIKHYAKRQLTWWKRNKNIIWIKNFQEAEKQIKKFIKYRTCAPCVIPSSEPESMLKNKRNTGFPLEFTPHLMRGGKDKKVSKVIQTRKS